LPGATERGVFSSSFFSFLPIRGFTFSILLLLLLWIASGKMTFDVV
jgi:hypothetical protein